MSPEESRGPKSTVAGEGMEPHGLEVTLYTRQGCHLCEDAKQVIDSLREVAEFRLKILDIDLDPELQARFTNEVPVIFINGRKAFKYRVEPRQLLRRLKH